ncbi:MAG: dynamin family protein [Cumulibacter sp.]
MAIEFVAETHRLLQLAVDSYSDEPSCVAHLHRVRSRLTEPVRIAFAGMVKAGKSTLLNAILGERLAPAEAGECTRALTIYRFGHAPRITAELANGDVVTLPVHAVDSQLDLSLGDAAQARRILVRWPAEILRTMTLVDTPGIGSLSGEVSMRTSTALAQSDAAAEADAVVYLTRRLHETDVRFLQQLAPSDNAIGATINTIAVLSRADETGAGRIDAMLTAQEIATRLRSDPALFGTVLGVFPVAGLLAQGARTLREEDLRTLRELAELDRAARDRMLVSGDRFVRPTAALTSTAQSRAGVLQRFGVHGIRVATSMVRGNDTMGVAELAPLLSSQSGLGDLQTAIGRHFVERADLLRARSAWRAVTGIAAARPEVLASARLLGEVDRLETAAHGLRELSSLARLIGSSPDIDWDSETVGQAQRLLGGYGTSAAARLRTPDSADASVLAEKARHGVRRWRASSNAETQRGLQQDISETVCRSAEELLIDAHPSAARGVLRLASGN